MIDVHCHLEQKDYDQDREEVISKCRKNIKAIITCCAHPKDFDKSLKIVKKHKGFIFLTAGFHPEFISELVSENYEIHEYFELLKENIKNLVGIGECGLDYYWVKDPKLREKQKDLFVEHIKFAEKQKLPIIIHSRDSEQDCLKILEEYSPKKVLLHFFSSKDLIQEVMRRDYFVSVNTAILRSKTIKKIVRRIPIERLMTETDSPWLGLGTRNTPLSVKKVVEKISELKNIDLEEVDETTTNNAKNFFNLRFN